MTTGQAPQRAGTYHVFPAGTLHPVAIDVRRLLLRGILAAAIGFALLVAAVILVALSPTLSRSVTAMFVGPQSGAVPWNGTDPVNMVIVGLDLRPGQTADPHTDTILVASIRPGTGSINMLSIPRDLYVNIPGYGDDRINDAYAVGGTKLLIKTVEGVTNLPIRYYTVIDFNGFQKVIDALGGVTIDVKRTIWDPTYPALTGYGYSPLFLKKGVHHMDGALALKFVRERHVYALQDLARNRAQQQLLSAMKEQILTPNTLFNLPVILSSLHAAVTTNFPYDDLTYLFRVAMTSRTNHYYLNYNNGAVSNYTTAAGADVLSPNWPRIHWITRRAFRDPDLSSSQVAVLNGSGVSGQAGELAHWLRASGFQIATVGDAGRTDYVHTEVIHNLSAEGGDFVARMLGDQMQTSVLEEKVPNDPSPVIVIVGKDWTSPVQS